MSSSTSQYSETARCQRCAVHDRAICAVVHLAGLNELSRVSRTRIVRADETILPENGDSSIVGNLVAGVIRLTKTAPDGRQQVVGLIYPGEFFGRPYADTTEFAYEAATDVELCVIERHAFERVVTHNPALEHELLLTTLSELAFARERAMLIGCHSTLERVATYLLAMLERREQILGHLATTSHKRIAVSAVSRRDLASYLSTTIETISRHIHYLSRTGVIRILDSSHFEVLDYPALLALSGLAQDELRLFHALRHALLGRRPDAARTA